MPNGGLRFLIDPDWRAVIRAEDEVYIESLLSGLPERAKEEPANLFKQVSALEVGPLVTAEAGERTADHTIISELFSGFVQL
jgi:hypothetical protein